MQIASDACIYTNENYTALRITADGDISEIDIKTGSSSSSSGGGSSSSSGSGGG